MHRYVASLVFLASCTAESQKKPCRYPDRLIADGTWSISPVSNLTCKCNNGQWDACFQATSQPETQRNKCLDTESGESTANGTWYSLPRSHCYCDDGVWTQCKPKKTDFEPCIVDESDIVLEWHTIAMNANGVDIAFPNPQQKGPLLTARVFAMTACAMYDAYNSITPIGTQCLYSSVSSTAGQTHRDVAIAVAAHDILVYSYSLQATFFDQCLRDTLSRYRTEAGRSKAKTDRVQLGVEVGQEIARNIIRLRASDFSDQIQTPAYQPNNQVGFHVVDPMDPTQGFYAPNGKKLKPFVIDPEFLDRFLANTLSPEILDPSRRQEFLQSQLYTSSYNEVLNLGSDGISYPTSRTEEQTFVGIFWGYDGRPFVGTPPRLYNQILREVMCLQKGNSQERVRLLALANLAMVDAAISCWTSKYRSVMWRPIVGIRNGQNDGNARTFGVTSWTPLGIPASNPKSAGDIDGRTPNFPSFTSGHSECGAALFTTLKLFYGQDNINFTVLSDEFNGKTTDSKGMVRARKPRSFTSFTQAMQENARSRVYLGVHWAFDADQGIMQGTVIAENVFAAALKPL
eukprot:gb/GEZN01002669.1/.p1 GENE.gb/GEZN01002669.1/~~gb/GEZN01002669.1/.p1  ORF type:complete len:572 (-),score=50.72 gb/GEZN01002669.1/:611-2326(-)